MISNQSEVNEIFKVGDDQLRVTGSYSEPWFMATDVCKILGLKNTTMAIKDLTDKEKYSKPIIGKQVILLISESGVFSLILNCKKRENAKKFQRAFLDTVLPTLKATGENKMKEKVLEEKKHLETIIYQKDVAIGELSRVKLRRERKVYPVGSCIYVLSHPKFPNNYKDGKSTNFNSRQKDYFTHTPEDYIVEYHRLTLRMDEVEAIIKTIFYKEKIDENRLEWFLLDDIKILIDTIDKLIDTIEEGITGKKTVPPPKSEPKSHTKPPKKTSKNPLKNPSKPCNVCKVIKPLEDFHNAKENGDGKENTCKECAKIRQKKYIEEQRKEYVLPEEKKCTDCEEVKKLEDFYCDKNALDGKSRKCKVCIRKIQKAGSSKLETPAEKTCTGCNETKSIDSFNLRKLSPDGRNPRCKDCVSLKTKQDYQKNKEKLREQKRKRRAEKAFEENPDIIINN